MSHIKLQQDMLTDEWVLKLLEIYGQLCFLQANGRPTATLVGSVGKSHTRHVTATTATHKCRCISVSIAGCLGSCSCQLQESTSSGCSTTVAHIAGFYQRCIIPAHRSLQNFTSILKHRVRFRVSDTTNSGGRLDFVTRKV